MPDYCNRIILPREYAQQLIPIIQRLPKRLCLVASGAPVHIVVAKLLLRIKSFMNKTLIAKKLSGKVQYSEQFKVYNVKPSRKT